MLAAVMRRVLVVAALAAWGCAAARRGEGLEPSALPANVRGDYELFASRCSRCHSLARPLGSNFDPARWRVYVERMRLQPASGIALSDVPGILRFLDWYSAHRAEVVGR